MTSPLLGVAALGKATADSGVFSLLWLVVASPLVGAVVLLAGGRRTDPWGPLLATLLPIG